MEKTLRAVRRDLCLPSGTHCNFLPLLNESLPVSVDVRKRSARFLLSCNKSKSKVLRSVASFSVLFGRHESIIGRNATFCCSHFNWNFSAFLIFFLSAVDTRNKVLCINYLHDADDSDRCSATLLAELISVRDGLSDISFSNGSVFAYDDVCDMILHFALL